MRTAIVGDIHGCLEELNELMGTLSLEEGDRIFFLGDLVDKGPDTVGVVRRVMEIVKEFPGSACVMGNHEEKVLRFHRRGKETYDFTDEEWEWLKGLPLFLRLEGDVFLVHGGLYPDYYKYYRGRMEPAEGWLDAQYKKSYSDERKKPFRQQRLLRTRMVTPEGKFVIFKMEKPDDIFWTEWYDGREGFVYFGHVSWRDGQPHESAHAVGLDTGCVLGNCLTAAVYTTDPRNPVFVSVPAKKQYSQWMDLSDL